MATAPPALPRRGHAFEVGGGGRSTQGFSNHVVGGGGSERKTSEPNWKPDLFGDSDDEDETPLSFVRSGPKNGSGSVRAPSPVTSWKPGSGGGAGGLGRRGEVSASGAKKEAGGSAVDKKRMLGEGGKVVGSSTIGPGSPATKKVKVAGGAAIMPKRDHSRGEDDEDDVPSSTRMTKMNPPTKNHVEVPTKICLDALTKNLVEGDMSLKISVAKKIMEDRKKAKMEGGLPGMANLSTTNGVSGPAKVMTVKKEPSSKESQGRVSNGAIDSKPVKSLMRPLMKPTVARSVGGNSVRDSDDSDDDKPLSHRKSMSLQMTRDSKPDIQMRREPKPELHTGGRESKPSSLEQKDSLLKKRPAGQTGHSSDPLPVKKLKIVPSGQQSQKSSTQSPKIGSLHSPRPMVKKEPNSTFKPPVRRPDPSDDDDDDDDIPLAQRISSLSAAGAAAKPPVVTKPAGPVKPAARVERDPDDYVDDDDDVPLARRIGQAPTPKPKVVAIIKKPSASSAKSITKKVLEQRRKGKTTSSTIKTSKHSVKTTTARTSKTEPSSGGSQKWETLEHSGVIFPPPYQPHGVKMLYKGKPVTLTPDQEEVATMFAVMKDTDYATKPKFVENFWADWQPILGKGHVIHDFENCDFTPIYNWHLAEKEKKKSLTSEEKKRMREEKLVVEEKYMWALVNGMKEKVGNFRVEPPGLFRGRGEHPKMGKLKKRIFPENIVINIGKGAPIPECPMPGHKWKEIRYDNTVTWLAFWNDPINNKEFKYVFLAASSSLKGQSDMEKYEKARALKGHIDNIRRTYTRNFNSSDPATKQIAVATYLIDRLALRAGNEKDEDEADTVGCCSLKVEHVILVPPSSLTFDFLGKDSIRYFNTVEVEAKVYSAIGDFKKGKHTGKDLFDKLDTSKLNQHLKGIMPALTAKVFRTYNASITLDTLLQDTVGSNALEKVADYQRANKEVAILCNHQRTVSKSHSSQMEKLEAKMKETTDLVAELRIDLDRARKGKPALRDSEGRPRKTQAPESIERKIVQAEQRVEKMKLDMRIKDDLKTVALGTSKINYMDPRITVAWCKRHEVPIEKVFNKSLLAKFAWAMDVEPDYRF